MELIDYSTILTNNVRRHIQMSVKAAQAEGNDCVYIEYDRIISNFCDTLTTEQYDIFDYEKAEDILFSYANQCIILN